MTEQREQTDWEVAGWWGLILLFVGLFWCGAGWAIIKTVQFVVTLLTRLFELIL